MEVLLLLLLLVSFFEISHLWFSCLHKVSVINRGLVYRMKYRVYILQVGAGWGDSVHWIND